MWFPLARRPVLPRESFALPASGPTMLAYYLVVFLTFVVALVVNFIGVFASHVLPGRHL